MTPNGQSHRRRFKVISNRAPNMVPPVKIMKMRSKLRNIECLLANPLLIFTYLSYHYKFICNICILYIYIYIFASSSTFPSSRNHTQSLVTVCVFPFNVARLFTLSSCVLNRPYEGHKASVEPDQMYHLPHVTHDQFNIIQTTNIHLAKAKIKHPISKYTGNKLQYEQAKTNLIM